MRWALTSLRGTLNRMGALAAVGKGLKTTLQTDLPEDIWQQVFFPWCGEEGLGIAEMLCEQAIKKASIRPGQGVR